MSNKLPYPPSIPSELNDLRDFDSARVGVWSLYVLPMRLWHREPHQFLPPRNLRRCGYGHCVIQVFPTLTRDIIVLGCVPGVNWGGHNKDLGMTAEFDVSKHSTCHDIHDDRVWIDHYKSKRRSGGDMGRKKSDECCEVEYDSDANMISPVRRKHQERR